MLAKIDQSASATALAVIDFRATALGHLVARQTLVRTYSHPPFPFGNGPTKSIAMLSNGSVITGQATMGALRGMYFECLWQVSQL